MRYRSDYSPSRCSPGRLGDIRPELAQRTGLQNVKTVVPATHDTGSAVLAVPASEFASSSPNWCYISSGTWSLMGVEIAKPLLTAKCLERNFTNEGGALGVFDCSRTSQGFGHFSNAEPRLLGRDKSLVGICWCRWRKHPSLCKVC